MKTCMFNWIGILFLAMAEGPSWARAQAQPRTVSRDCTFADDRSASQREEVLAAGVRGRPCHPDSIFPRLVRLLRFRCRHRGPLSRGLRE